MEARAFELPLTQLLVWPALVLIFESSNAFIAWRIKLAVEDRAARRRLLFFLQVSLLLTGLSWRAAVALPELLESTLMLLILAIVGIGAGHTRAEAILLSIAHSPVQLPSTEIAITASIGIAMSESGHTLDEVLEVADQALYRAKDSGRNQIVG